MWAWGENSLGQLADQAARSRLTPIAVHLPAVALLATAANGTLASTTDDSVYFWGDNWDLSARSVKTAVHVAGITNAVSIAAGGMHSIAVKGDGTVWTWGDAFWGQLGNVISTNMTSPQQVTALSGVSAVGAGWVYSVALKSDGTIVWTWGDNVFGQLGDGTGVNSSTPVPVSGLSGVAAVQFGGHHGLALKSDHTIWAWGGNWSGQLGDGTTGNRWTPVAVSGPPAVAGTKIAAGENHSLAVVSGAAWAWGSNGRGQIGHGTPDGAPHAPVQVSGLTGVVTAVAGGCVHSIALKGDGTVWAWGGNDRGQLGNGSFTDSATPVAVSGLSGITAIAAGYYSSLALRSDGTVWAWGENKYGQLGNGGSADRNTPVPVTGLSGITAIAAGNGSHCLAIKSDGTVWAWGDGELGQAGGGLISLALTPVEVTLP